jgi:hypothetical protein
MSQFEDFTPEDMMSPAERRSAWRHLAALDRHHQRWRDDDLLPAAQRLPREKWLADNKQIRARMDVLASAVLQRSVGLERYMVVYVRRDDGFEAKFQVLSLGLETYSRSLRRLTWNLGGRALRKDGTLGVTPSSICFTHAAIVRRRLDGSWDQLGRLPMNMGLQESVHAA